jgi:hypothetical protein
MSEVEPFEEVLARPAAARPEQYAGALRAGAERAGVAPEAAPAEFERMKAHILHFYQGVRPVHSYLDAAGHPVDCVPFDQQPSARAAAAAGHKVFRTPPPPSRPEGSVRHPPAGGGHPGVPPQGARASADERSACPEGTVPIPRLTLDRLVSLGTLDNFFRKFPAVQPPAHG